jgi:hypothetical protein
VIPAFEVTYYRKLRRNVIFTQKPELEIQIEVLKIIMEFNRAGEICLAFVA